MYHESWPSQLVNHWLGLLFNFLTVTILVMLLRARDERRISMECCKSEVKLYRMKILRPTASEQHVY